jgi:hypothetical protein
VAVDEIVDVVPVRHRFVTAPRSVDVVRLVAAAVVARRTLVRIFRTDFKRMLVYVIAVRMMQMAVVQIIDVTVVLDCGMPTVRAMLMIVLGVMRFVANAHVDAPVVEAPPLAGIAKHMTESVTTTRWPVAKRSLCPPVGQWRNSIAIIAHRMARGAAVPAAARSERALGTPASHPFAAPALVTGRQGLSGCV